MSLSSKLLKLLSFCLAIFPACFLAVLILIYGVNLPYWDQWKIAPLFEKINNNSLSFNDLFAQHNESRKFFPRLVFISLAYLTHWDVKYEMLFMFLLACIISLNIYCLSRLTLGGSTIKRLLIAAISNLLIFSPIQWENWLWGIQIVVFIPILCITTCVLLAYSRLSVIAKFLISICLCIISTFSYANGILAWIVVFPILILKSRNQLNKNRWLVFLWIASFIFSAVTYFYNYKKPEHHPSFLEALAHPQQAIQYFLSFLGAPLGIGNVVDSKTSALTIGLVLLLLLFASCFYLLRFIRDYALLDRMAGWLTIGLYTLISATITTLGRLGLGLEYSLSSRYTTFSVYLIVSLVHIIPIIADDIKNKGFFLKDKKLKTQILPFLIAIILILHIHTSIQAIQQMNNVKLARLQGKSCLLFINIVEEQCLTEKVFPELNELKQTANILDSIGFIKPGLVKSSRIQEIEGGDDYRAKNYGTFDTLKKVSNDIYIASGWAVLQKRQEATDAVILTYENENSDATVFTVVTNRATRNDIAKNFKNQSYSNSGWQKSFSSIGLPKGNLKINAWAFDSTTGKAFKLNSVHEINNSSTVNTVGKINFKATTTNNGVFDVVNNSSELKHEVSKGSVIKLGGWAVLADKRKPADMVVITFGNKNSLVATAPVDIMRPDVVKALNNPSYQYSGWETGFNVSSLPEGKVVFKAWAYDSETKEAVQLNHTHEIFISN